MLPPLFTSPLAPNLGGGGLMPGGGPLIPRGGIGPRGPFICMLFIGPLIGPGPLMLPGGPGECIETR